MLANDQLPWLLDCWEDIEQQIRSSEQYFLGFDFDGTLARIVRQPDTAVMDPLVAESLQELMQKANVHISVLSGRSLEDLTQRVALRGCALSGDHGFKVQFPDRSIVTPVDYDGGIKLDQINREVIDSVSKYEGVQVDRKEFSLTVHYRNASPDLSEKIRGLIKNVIGDSSFRIFPGRMCWEIKPAVDWDKGKVYQWLSNKLLENDQRAFKLYIGDDRTDEDVFAVLGNEAFPVLVKSAEKSGSTHAKYYLNSTTEVSEFLFKLNRLI